MGWHRFHSIVEAHEPLPLFVLQEPIVKNNTLQQKGVLLVGHKLVDDLIQTFGDNFKKYWFIISIMQSHLYGDSINADLHFFIDKKNNQLYLNSLAGQIPFRNFDTNGTFVDTSIFYPINRKKEYDVIYIAKWIDRKRIEILVNAFSILKNKKALILGFLMKDENNKSSSELYRKNILDLIDKTGANIDVIEPDQDFHNNPDGSIVPGGFTKDEIREYINNARISILLADTLESINRSICEALSCNLRIITTRDTQGGLPELLINKKTGELCYSNPEDLANVVMYVLDNYNTYTPREWFCKNYGKVNQNNKLLSIIEQISKEKNSPILCNGKRQFGGDPWTLDYYNIVNKINYK